MKTERRPLSTQILPGAEGAGPPGGQPQNYESIIAGSAGLSTNKEQDCYFVSADFDAVSAFGLLSFFVALSLSPESLPESDFPSESDLEAVVPEAFLA